MNDQSLSQNKIMAGSSLKSSINAGGSTGVSSEKQTSAKSNNSKIMITGDDILIEYVTRLVKAMNMVQVELVQQSHLQSMDKFVTHYVWKQPD